MKRRYQGLWIVSIVLGTHFLGLPAKIRFHWNRYRTLPQIDFKLIDVTEEAGIRFKHEGYRVHPSLRSVEPWLSVTGAGVAVTDIDNDGWRDLFVVNSKVRSSNQLYLNNGDGTFRESAKERGIAFTSEDYPTTGVLFLDCDNDGHQDLFALSYCPQLYRNDTKGHFHKQENSDFQCLAVTTAVNTFDFDRDGFLDLIIAPFWEEGMDIFKNPPSTEVMPGSVYFDSRKADVAIYRNEGNCRFKKVPGALGIKGRGFNHTIGIIDVRNQGRQDVWLAASNGPASLYLERKDSYENASNKITGFHLSVFGMNFDASDIDNNGLPNMYTSHIFQEFEKTSGNRLWEWNGEDPLKETASDQGINRCLWSWGAKFADLNNDGFQDLAVANGFITGKNAKSYEYFMAMMDGANKGLVKDARNWPEWGEYSFSGKQRDCIFLNGNKGFTDVTSATEFDTGRLDGRGVALIDILNDGNISLAVANQRGEFKLYQNLPRKTKNWIGFEFIGSQSNRDALGTKVRLYLNDRVISQELRYTNGFASQSDDRMHFGLGVSVPNRAEIIWPSGKTQQLAREELQLRRYHIIKEAQSVASR